EAVPRGDVSTQLASLRLVPAGSLQLCSDPIDFRLAECSFDTENERVVSLSDVVHPFLVRDEGPRELAHLQQREPVGSVAGQSGDLKPDDDSHFASTDVADHALEG